MPDLLTAPLELIRNIVGEISTGGAIPFFDPFYNLVVILWMAAIAAIASYHRASKGMWSFEIHKQSKIKQFIEL